MSESAKEFWTLPDAAKSGGAPLSFGSPGRGSPHQLATEALGKAAGVPVKHVAYKGSSAAVTDLAGGQIDMVVAALPSLLPLVDAGKVKIIATTGAARSELRPDVPAVAETYPGIDLSIWLGIMTADGAPAEATGTVNKTLDEILADPATVEVNRAGFAGGSNS